MGFGFLKKVLGGKEKAPGGKPSEAQDRREKDEALKKLEDLAKGGDEALYRALGISTERTVVETYWLRKPFEMVKILYAPDLPGGYEYVIEGATLTEDERKAAERLLDLVSKELRPPENGDVDAEEYVLSEAKRLAKKYARSLKMKRFDEISKDRIFHQVVRELAGFGTLQPLMEDPNIEDISCNGVGKPIYIWHQKYESIPTSLCFKDERSLDDFVMKLAHVSGKHISSAHPVLDGTLPRKHRIASTFMHEISTTGSTFCIRKFRETPFSIIDLIRFGTLDEALAAYVWLLLDHKASFMVIGSTGAGKTTVLNALASLMAPNTKVVTVEETAELNLPHENWVPLVARRGFSFAGSDDASISLFDHVKVSLRYRPDYIVVGEIRGEEAYVLFQALATGHGGLCTIHADSLENVVKRLTSPPMNISEAYIPLMNFAVYISRVRLPKGGSGRRIVKAWEILDYGKYNVIYQWSPLTDKFELNLEGSGFLKKISAFTGIEVKELVAEFERRKAFLRWLTLKNVVSYRTLAKAIASYPILFPRMNGKPVHWTPELLEIEAKVAERLESPRPELGSEVGAKGAEVGAEAGTGAEAKGAETELKVGGKDSSGGS